MFVFRQFVPQHYCVNSFRGVETYPKSELGRCVSKATGRCSKPLDRRSNKLTMVSTNRFRRRFNIFVDVLDRLSISFEQRPGCVGAHRPNLVFSIGLDASKLAKRNMLGGKGRKPEHCKNHVLKPECIYNI